MLKDHKLGYYWIMASLMNAKQGETVNITYGFYVVLCYIFICLSMNKFL